MRRPTVGVPAGQRAVPENGNRVSAGLDGTWAGPGAAIPVTTRSADAKRARHCIQERSVSRITL